MLFLRLIGFPVPPVVVPAARGTVGLLGPAVGLLRPAVGVGLLLGPVLAALAGRTVVPVFPLFGGVSGGFFLVLSGRSGPTGPVLTALAGRH